MAKATVYFLPSLNTLYFFPGNNTIIVPALWMLLGKLYLLVTADLLIQSLFQCQLLPYNSHLSPVHSVDRGRLFSDTLLIFLNFTTGFHAVWERIPVSGLQFARSSSCSQPGFWATFHLFTFCSFFLLQLALIKNKNKNRKTNQLNFRNSFLSYQDLVICYVIFFSFCSGRDGTRGLKYARSGSLLSCPPAQDDF